MSKRVDKTTFTSRGRLAGLVRAGDPTGSGQNRSSRSEERDADRPGGGDSLFHRARIVLGDSRRPGR